MDANAQLLAAIENYHKPLWISEVTLNRNDYLHPSGALDTNIYYVEEGALRIIHETEEDLHTIRFGYSGSLFTSLDSFISGKPSVYAVQALKRVKVKVMTREDFMEFLYSDNTNLMLWNTILSYTVFSLLERELDLLTASPSERYERVLKRSPRLFQEIPHKYIASYLRMAPETLSRLQKS